MVARYLLLKFGPLFMKSTLLLISFFSACRVFAQLQPGAVASDFTVQDVNGITRNLYSQLDSGKTVVLHCFAAWDSYAWEYYQQQTLDAFDALYGATGNGAAAVWRVECEGTNEYAQLLGPAANTGSPSTSTQGDWISGSMLPLIDDSTLAASWDLDYVPVVVVICPDRIIRFTDQLSLGNLTNLVFQTSCPPVISGYDPALATASIQRNCGNNSADVSLVLKNLGTDTLFNTVVEVGGAVATQSIEWQGSLPSYQSDTILIVGLEIITDAPIRFAINQDNLNNQNDSLQVRSEVGYSTLLVKLELALDAYPQEVSWEIRDEADSVLYSGGGYEVDYQYISNVFMLPAQGCYSLFLNDSRGDGLHGSQYGGFDGFCKLYSMIDSTTVEEEMFHYDGSYNFSEIDNSPSFLQYAFEAGSSIGVNRERESNWMIYPMPASNAVYVQSKVGVSDYEVNVLDTFGRTMLPTVHSFAQARVNLDVTNLASGLYIVSVETSSSRRNFPILIQH